jgi:hypothetical protein
MASLTFDSCSKTAATSNTWMRKSAVTWGSDGLIDFEAGRWIATLDALIGRIVDGCAVVAMRAWWRWLCLLGRVCGRFG